VTNTNMGNRIFLAGVLFAALFPAIAAIGFAAHAAMGCSGGGSSGPVVGCHLFGGEFNLIASLATPAFVACFFAIPIGVVICVCGLIVTAMTPAGRGVYGVYGPEGKLLALPEASAAIARFDRAECDNLLRSFGKTVSTPEEKLLLLQARCIQLLIAKEAYAS
jgi:hypothetical protein